MEHGRKRSTPCSGKGLGESSSQGIKRFPGQHQRVGATVYRRVWNAEGVLTAADEMELKDVHQILDKEIEKERRRRMSEPFGHDKSTTALHIENRKRRLSDVHEDLFKLFAINTAVTQRKFEQQRLIAETNKQLVQEELLRKSMAKAVKEAVEIERQERIKTLQEMADGRQDSTYAVANTNENLARVHKELKKLFHHIETGEIGEENRKASKRSDLKRRVNSLSSKRRLTVELSEIKKKRLEEDKQLKSTLECRKIVRDKLKGVQQEILSIFGSFKGKTAAKKDKDSVRNEAGPSGDVSKSANDKSGDAADAGSSKAPVKTLTSLRATFKLL